MEEPLKSVCRSCICFKIWLGGEPPPADCERVTRPLVTENFESMQAWQDHLERILPKEYKHIERNAAITRQYACWYLKKPDIFKWAGMAAFASHRAGFFMLQDDNANPDSRLMRTVNNDVFRDIGWAHLAYLEKGFKEIRRILDGVTGYELMLKGFELINRGDELLEGKRQTNQNWDASREKAKNLIWRGNLLLLKHEQSITIQNIFSRDMRYGFKLSLGSLSWATILDFDANNFKTDKSFKASFDEYARESNLSLDFTKFEDRWAWIVAEGLPKWQEINKKKRKHVKKKLRTIAHCRDASLLIMATYLLKKSPVKTLFNEFDLLTNVMAVFSMALRIWEAFGSILTYLLLRWVLLPLKVYKE